MSIVFSVLLLLFVTSILVAIFVSVPA